MLFEPQLFYNLIIVANKLDQNGFREEADVVDIVLRELAVKHLSHIKLKAELQMTKNWTNYNHVATKVRELEKKVANLKLIGGESVKRNRIGGGSNRA